MSELGPGTLALHNHCLHCGPSRPRLEHLVPYYLVVPQDCHKRTIPEQSKLYNFIQTPLEVCFIIKAKLETCSHIKAQLKLRYIIKAMLKNSGIF